MKAEHRKELQTNLLADRMGRLVQGIKERPKRRFMLWSVLGLVVLGALFFFYRLRTSEAKEESDRWTMLEDAFRPYIDELKDKYGDTNPGKAARFQYAWVAMWDLGLRQLGGKQANEGLQNMRVAESLYKRLAQECEKDPIWEPEARYALAVIEETRAIQRKDRKEHLENAQAMYKKLAADHPNTALGEKAKQRAELLETKSREILEFYADLQGRLGIQEPLPDFLMPKGKQ